MTTNDSFETGAGNLSAEVTVDLVAGRHPNGDWIFERLLVAREQQANTYQVLKSPVFVRGIARGDIIQQLDQPAGAFSVIQHGGNLCVRVFSQATFDDNSALTALRQNVVAEIEKLGGDLDVSEPGVLVFSIHVGCGFTTIETLLDRLLGAREDVTWIYGNVYDTETGEPLNWWQPILSPG